MIIISLGSTCYVKDLIKQTKYDNSTDIFDQINSFYFNQLIKSPIMEDLSHNIYYNDLYFFRLPHEYKL